MSSAGVKLASLFLAAAALVGCEGGGYYSGGSYSYSGGGAAVAVPAGNGTAAVLPTGGTVLGPDGITRVMPNGSGGFYVLGPGGITSVLPY